MSFARLCSTSIQNRPLLKLDFYYNRYGILFVSIDSSSHVWNKRILKQVLSKSWRIFDRFCTSYTISLVYKICGSIFMFKNRLFAIFVNNVKTWIIKHVVTNLITATSIQIRPNEHVIRVHCHLKQGFGLGWMYPISSSIFPMLFMMFYTLTLLSIFHD